MYQKLADYCILIAGRSFDSGIWRRRDASGVDQELAQSVAQQEIAGNGSPDMATTKRRPSAKLERGQEGTIRLVGL